MVPVFVDDFIGSTELVYIQTCIASNSLFGGLWKRIQARGRDHGDQIAADLSSYDVYIQSKRGSYT